MSGKVQPNDLQGVFAFSHQQNYTHLTLFSPETYFCREEVGERKKSERAEDDGKANEMNIGYIQSSSQMRRRLEMHDRAEQSAPDPIGLNPLVSLWSLQNVVFFITSTLHLDEILLSKCSSKGMSLKFLRKKSFRRAWVVIELGV